MDQSKREEARKKILIAIGFKVVTAEGRTERMLQLHHFLECCRRGHLEQVAQLLFGKPVAEIAGGEAGIATIAKVAAELFDENDQLIPEAREWIDEITRDIEP